MRTSRIKPQVPKIFVKDDTWEVSVSVDPSGSTPHTALDVSVRRVGSVQWSRSLNRLSVSFLLKESGYYPLLTFPLSAETSKCFLETIARVLQNWKHDGVLWLLVSGKESLYRIPGNPTIPVGTKVMVKKGATRWAEANGYDLVYGQIDNCAGIIGCGPGQCGCDPPHDNTYQVCLNDSVYDSVDLIRDWFEIIIPRKE